MNTPYASFIVLLGEHRIPTWNQALRLLSLLDEQILTLSELVVVFHSPSGKQYEISDNAFKSVNVTIDQSPCYQKPKFTNIGVEVSRSDNLVLLDSDRVLPQNYFLRTMDLLEACPEKIFTTQRILDLEKTISDRDVLHRKGRGKEYKRSRLNRPFCKNLFSGNTTLKKSIYHLLGGYDESFRGHGFADNDLTFRAEERGVFQDDLEYHLFHPPYYFEHGKEKSLALQKDQTAKNFLLYHQKHDLVVSQSNLRYLKSTGMNVPRSLFRELHL